MYCSHHRQILGLQPRTAAKRGQGKAGGGGKSRADLRSKGAHTALMSVLAKHGIPEKSPKRKGATTPNTKKIKSEYFVLRRAIACYQLPLIYSCAVVRVRVRVVGLQGDTIGRCG